MIEPLLLAYACFATLIVVGLWGVLLCRTLCERRTRSRDAVLREKYLRIVMTCLAQPRRRDPSFPLIDHSGARLLLVETLAGLTSVTYGLDPGPLRRIVRRYGLDGWLVRRIRRSRGYRRARYLTLLSRLPVQKRCAAGIGRYAAARNRSVSFCALLARLSSDPSAALRLIAAYPRPLLAGEIAEIVSMLRRGMLPVAYAPLVASPSPNLRRVGLAIVRRFGIEQAEETLLALIDADCEADIACEALYTLCALRRPLRPARMRRRIAAMRPAERRSLLRYLVQEGYAAGELSPLFATEERPYYESLVQSYKRCLVCR